ncbi:MAG TPA: 30S ribosomal protein S16 [Candidatus Saccharimonadales bacterium]|nr:30S ribosomal protein S16 [Candidatus Saccharimonadales bacterium]
MLIIRYRRIGKKNSPTYRVVVAEHTMPIDGRFVADLGSYNPHSKATTINKDEAMNWLNKGAKPSNSVARLFEKEKIKHGSVVVIKKKRNPKKAVEEAAKAAPAPEAAAETQAENAAPEPTAEVVTEEVPAADDAAPAEEPVAE